MSSGQADVLLGHREEEEEEEKETYRGVMLSKDRWKDATVDPVSSAEACWRESGRMRPERARVHTHTHTHKSLPSHSKACSLVV